MLKFQIGFSQWVHEKLFWLLEKQTCCNIVWGCIIYMWNFFLMGTKNCVQSWPPFLYIFRAFFVFFNHFGEYAWKLMKKFQNKRRFFNFSHVFVRFLTIFFSYFWKFWQNRDNTRSCTRFFPKCGQKRGKRMIPQSWMFFCIFQKLKVLFSVRTVYQNMEKTHSSSGIMPDYIMPGIIFWGVRHNNYYAFTVPFPI